jgi:hypothetical protein
MLEEKKFKEKEKGEEREARMNQVRTTTLVLIATQRILKF